MNNHVLILLSSLARYSQEPKLKKEEILWVLVEKISVCYSDWPKSWILWTLRYVRNMFLIVIFITLQKSPSAKKIWIPCLGLKLPKFNSGKMVLLKLCMKFKNNFVWKTPLEVLCRWYLQKISLTCPRVRQIQDLGQSE